MVTFRMSKHSRSKNDRRVLALVLSLALYLSILIAAPAPTGSAAAPELLSDQLRAEVIDSVASWYRARYLYPDLGIQMDSLLHAQLEMGQYNSTATLADLCRAIREDLRELARDGHIWVEQIYDEHWYVAEGETATEEQIRAQRRENFEWKEVRWLPGAVAYLRVDLFDDPAYAGETAERILSSLANCEALIFDLRRHHGGYDTMLQLVTSYFFRERTQLNSLYWTFCDSTLEAWTQDTVRGTPLYDKTLYLLTSHETGSGAEAFAYNLKHLGRATVIGESTVGAAHWTDTYEIPHLSLALHVPVARPINPVTGTSWERVGVIPHIAVNAADALDAAYVEALNELKAKSDDESWTRRLDWILVAAQAKLHPVTINPEIEDQYIGRYEHPDKRRVYGIIRENGGLQYLHYSGRTFRLSPLTETLFAFPDSEDQRLEIVMDSNKQVSGIQIVDSDGEVHYRPRIKE